MTATALSTDLYELTMLAGYVEAGRHESVTATFELFVRHLPPHRNYLVAAGLHSLLDYLEALHFSDDEVRWLRNLPAFRSLPIAFFDYLRRFAFEGDVSAIQEGTPMFANEPLVQVTAPLGQAQIIETAALAIVNFQTTIASKAARIVHAAGSKPVIEFGARRAHGTEAALYAARSAYVGGCAGTSYVEAGRRFDIPLSGTMAHSWVLSAANEIEAFSDYTRLFGDRSTLLLDTYDTIAAARAIVAAGLRPPAVRLDSGDTIALSRAVRAILDDAGLRETQILVSGDLDEHVIAHMRAENAPIDAFGVGTSLVTSIDAPALGGVYKIVALREHGIDRSVMKQSEGKTTWPGRKQVWRTSDDGRATGDLIDIAGQIGPVGGAPLLEPVMRSGRRIHPSPTLDAIRDGRAAHLQTLPPQLLAIDHDARYRVTPGAALQQLLLGSARERTRPGGSGEAE